MLNIALQCHLEMTIIRKAGVETGKVQVALQAINTKRDTECKVYSAADRKRQKKKKGFYFVSFQAF